MSDTRQSTIVDDLPERLDVGGEVPAGECECGALAYVVRRPRGQS